MIQKSLLLPVLRCLSILLVMVCAAAHYAEWNLTLSPESLKYQADYPDAIRSGLSLLFLFSKFFWVAGTLFGVIGTALIVFSKRRGLVLVALAAPLIALGAYMQAPQSNYPSVQPMLVLLLWCASSAIWAAVVALAWLREA